MRLGIGLAVVFAGAIGCANNTEDLGLNDASGVDIPDAGANVPDTGAIDAGMLDAGRGDANTPSERCSFIRGGGVRGAPLNGDLCITVLDDFNAPVAGASIRIACGATPISAMTSAHGHVELSDPCLSGNIDVRVTKVGFTQAGVLGVQADALTVALSSNGQSGLFGRLRVQLRDPIAPGTFGAAALYQTSVPIIPGSLETVPLHVPLDEAHTILLTQTSTRPDELLRYGVATSTAIVDPFIEGRVEGTLDRRFTERLHVRGRSREPEYRDQIELTVRLKEDEPPITFTGNTLDEDRILGLFNAEDAASLRLGATYQRFQPYSGFIRSRQWMLLDVEPGTVIDGDLLDFLDLPAPDGLLPRGAGARRAFCPSEFPPEPEVLWVLDDRALDGSCAVNAYSNEGFDPRAVRFYEVLRARRGSAYLIRRG